MPIRGMRPRWRQLSRSSSPTPGRYGCTTTAGRVPTSAAVVAVAVAGTSGGALMTQARLDAASGGVGVRLAGVPLQALLERGQQRDYASAHQSARGRVG